MSPQPNTPSGSSPAEFPNPNYWFQMAAWINLVIMFLELKYGLLFVIPPGYPQIFTLPFTDTLTGLSSIEMFMVYCVQLQQMWPITASQYAANMSNPSGFADALVTQLFNSLGKNPPAQLPPLTAPPIPVPPLPTNPIGGAFKDGGEQDYVDLGSPSILIGGTYTDPMGAKYTKQGARGPFGMQTWFTKNS